MIPSVRCKWYNGVAEACSMRNVVWRLDINLNLPNFGSVATLGVIDVDASTADVLPLKSDAISDLVKTANALAARFSPHTAADIYYAVIRRR